MSLLDKLAAKIMPPESDEDRVNARKVAQSVAGDGDWLAIVLEHHQQIERQFDRALNAPGGEARLAALKELGTFLTGHANAEESVLYPALTTIGEKGHAVMGYEEQAMAKIEMALLEALDPMSDEWRAKLDHIRGAVLHHVYEEEGTWFPQLQQNMSAAERPRLTRRFTEEFERYTRGPTSTYQPPLQQAASRFGQDRAPSTQSDLGEPPLGK